MKILLKNGNNSYHGQDGSLWTIIVDDDINLAEYVTIIGAVLGKPAKIERFPFEMERYVNWKRFCFKNGYEVVHYNIAVFPDRTIRITNGTSLQTLVYSGTIEDFTKRKSPKTGDIIQFTYLSGGKSPSFRCVQVKQSDHNSFEGFDLSQPVGSAYRKFKLERVQGDIKTIE